MTELLPTLATFPWASSVDIEVRGGTPGELTVWHLGDLVACEPYDGRGTISLGTLPAGCYGIELTQGDEVVRTAVEVSLDASARHRYGFVVDYSPDRDVSGVTDLARRLHLTDVQFYDWAYRHADLLGGGDETVVGALSAYGVALGRAFQIADDILDATGDPNQTGKSATDAANGKLTATALFGVEGAREMAHNARDEALAALNSFGSSADALRDLARFVVEREK